ncbi:hypothetical protein CL657_04670 [bacterium]|nr:hypothetical protein [bacterium]
MFQQEPITLTDSLLAKILSQPYTSFLDCNAHAKDHDTSIIGIDPVYTFFAEKDRLIVRQGKKKYIHNDKNIFDLIESYIKPCEKNKDQRGFRTGFIGMFTFESARCFSDFNWLKSDDYPEVLGGIYDRYLVIPQDHSQAYFVASTLYGRPTISFKELQNQFSNQQNDFKVIGNYNNPQKETYKQAVNHILNYIKKGHVYQVNFSRQHSVKFDGDLSVLYRQLRTVSPAPYSAYINFKQHHILSSSPELFFNVRKNIITTKPIKGTIARGATPDLDSSLKNQLHESIKDKAELLMIVDLERNDLNKICQTGSVKVTSPRAIESYQYVHHGMAVITGELKKNQTFYSIMKALFPGGSITGAPKKRAIEIISEFEKQPRGPYTGCIGYISGNGDLTFNIAIRTLYSRANQLLFHTGGGIVSDSVDELEWAECETKAKGMVETLLTI